MNAPDRRAALLAELQKAPWRAGFFSTLRRLEAADPKAPPLGRSRRPEDDPVRLGQEPDLAFAAATVTAVQPGRGRRPPRIQSAFLGLFGPNGPLPLHLTEYARQRIRNHGDHTFAAFADLFHHRLQSLFYRAWADARPAPGADHGERDPFAACVAALAGIGLPGLRHRDALPDEARLHHAGRLAALPRTPDALERGLADQLGIPVRVVEFAGHWQHLEKEDLCRLGSGEPATTALGRTALLGSSVWSAADRFRIVFGPLGLERYRELRPGRPLGDELIALVGALAGRELDWEVEWVVRADQVPSLHLDGTGALGVDSWAISRPPRRDPRVRSAGSTDPAVLDGQPAWPTPEART